MKEDKILAYLNNECSKDEIKEVEEWITNNPSSFKKLEYIWNHSKTETIDEPNVKKAWERINPEKQTKSLQLQPLFTKIGKVAAIILITIGLSLILLQQVFKSENKLLSLESVKQKNTELTLPDGSTLWLNSNSKIYYPKTFKKKREVFLEGEAYFEIEKDKSKPFMVHTGNSVTKVLGTSFNIDAKSIGDTISVTVVEGLVAFYDILNSDKQVLLTKGNKGIYSVISREVEKEQNSDVNFLSWKTGKIIFQKTPLLQVCRELEKYFNTPFIIKDKTLYEKNLTVTLVNKNLEDVLKILSYTLDITYESTLNGILFYSKNQGS